MIKPATTTTADDATTTTTADTGIVEPENPQPIPPVDPALRSTSIEAAKAVQIAVDEIKHDLDNVMTYGYDFNADILNRLTRGRPRYSLLSAKSRIDIAKTKLADTSDDGPRMLSQKAADKTDDPSAYFQTAAAAAHIVTDMDLTEDARAEDLIAIAAAQTQVNDLKKLADAAVEAAEAVQ